MYSVKQVVEMTGLPASTLRVWERRYGVVSPRRTASHYRMFSEDDVTRLRSMVQLIEAGATASVAATAVMDRQATAAPRPSDGEVEPAAFVAAAKSFDMGAMSDMLALGVTSPHFEEDCEEWLTPVVELLADQLGAGRLTRAHVRCAERAIERRLGTLLDQTWSSQREGSQARGAPVVLVGREGETTSDIGPLALTTSLRHHGLDARFLGGSIPLAAWEAAADQVSPRGVAMIVSTNEGLVAGRELARELAERRPPVMVWLGEDGGSAPDTEAVDLLPSSLPEASRTVVNHLRGGHQPDD